MTKVQQALAELEAMYVALPADAYDLDDVCGAGEDAIEAVLYEVEIPTDAEKERANECGTAAAKIRAVALANLGEDAENSVIVKAENAIICEFGFDSVDDFIRAVYAEDVA